MRIIQRPATAAVAIALGLVALLVGASLVMLRDGHWPWHTSISNSVGIGWGLPPDLGHGVYAAGASLTDAERMLFS
jgi:hypothetical protein